MRIVGVSHACVVDVNQRVFARLAAMGHHVTIVVPNRWKHEYSPRAVEPTKLREFRGELISLPVALAGQVPLHFYLSKPSSVLSRVQPDVVYLDEEPYGVSAFQWTRAAVRSNRPVVFYTVQNIAKRYPIPFRASERYVWRNSVTAACTTPRVAQALLNRGYRGRRRILPFAVDVEEFRPLPRDAEVATALGLRDQVVAFAGRLVKEKGIHWLLRAYQRMPNREAVSLLLIGSGPLADDCRRVQGAVVLEGVQHQDVARYLSLADVVVLPSLTTHNWKEQFGRAAVEAMACGKPVVGSDSGEIPHLLSETGGGTTVAEGDVDALTVELGRILLDAASREELGKRGRDAVVKLFATDRIAQGLEAILAEAIERAQDSHRSG